MPATYNDRIAAEVRAHMARRRLRQWELAVRLDWSTAMLRRRLAGEVAWSTNDIEHVARVLDIPLHELVSPKAS